MNKLADRLNRLSPSATLAMSQKSQELKAQGVDVINMSVGEPDFNTPDNIKEAAKKAVDDNWSRYSPVPGYPTLRKAIVEKLKNEVMVTIEPKFSVLYTRYPYISSFGAAFSIFCNETERNFLIKSACALVKNVVR